MPPEPLAPAASKQAPEPAKPEPKQIRIPDEHAVLWDEVRKRPTQGMAVLAAELILGKKVKAKQTGGRCWLFVGKARTTPYGGPSWPDAIARMVRMLAEGKPDPEEMLAREGLSKKEGIEG